MCFFRPHLHRWEVRRQAVVSRIIWRPATTRCPGIRRLDIIKTGLSGAGVDGPSRRKSVIALNFVFIMEDMVYISNV